MIILIIGQSGAGKTRACKNLENSVILQCLPKRLPFKKSDSVVTHATESLESLEVALKKALVSTKSDIFVVDDFQFPILKRLILESKKDGFKCYLQTAEAVMNLLEMAEKSDKRFYFLMHEERSENGDISPLTAGKLMKEKFPIEGFFTLVLRCSKSNDEHFFETKAQNSVVKSPEGMFLSDKIENDLAFVDICISDFYGLKKGGENESTVKKI